MGEETQKGGEQSRPWDLLAGEDTVHLWEGPRREAMKKPGDHAYMYGDCMPDVYAQFPATQIVPSSLDLRGMRDIQTLPSGFPTVRIDPLHYNRRSPTQGRLLSQDARNLVERLCGDQRQGGGFALRQIAALYDLEYRQRMGAPYFARDYEGILIVDTYDYLAAAQAEHSRVERIMPYIWHLLNEYQSFLVIAEDRHGLDDSDPEAFQAVHGPCAAVRVVYPRTRYEQGTLVRYRLLADQVNVEVKDDTPFEPTHVTVYPSAWASLIADGYRRYGNPTTGRKAHPKYSVLLSTTQEGRAVGYRFRLPWEQQEAA